MTVAVRLSPYDVLTAEEWARLRARSSLWGLALVAHAWGLIVLAGGVFVLAPSPLTYILAVLVIGGRQLGLAILMHEAAHGGLSPHQRFNDFVGQWFCAAPVGASLQSYRRYHLGHHKHANGPNDPDLGLAAAFPTTRASLWRKAVRDLTGQTFLKQRTAQLGGLLRFQARRMRGKENRSVPPAGAVPFVASNAVLFLGLTAVGLWWAYFVLWLVPLATWNMWITRLRNIAEHACLPHPLDAFGQARTTRAAWWEGLLIAPYWVNYHAEHHMFMHLPCYRLGTLHRMLGQRGFHGRMELADGYWQVVEKAAPQHEAASSV
jgi:fatty acid desaturase